jgi:hypothetical protein
MLKEGLPLKQTRQQWITGVITVALVAGPMYQGFHSQKNCPPQGWCGYTDFTLPEEHPHVPEENGRTSPRDFVNNSGASGGFGGNNNNNNSGGGSTTGNNNSSSST